MRLGGECALFRCSLLKGIMLGCWSCDRCSNSSHDLRVVWLSYGWISPNDTQPATFPGCPRVHLGDNSNRQLCTGSMEVHFDQVFRLVCSAVSAHGVLTKARRCIRLLLANLETRSQWDNAITYRAYWRLSHDKQRLTSHTTKKQPKSTSWPANSPLIICPPISCIQIRLNS